MSLHVSALRGALAAIGVMAAAGCAYQGHENPVARKFSWFSYLSGDDIRSRCQAGEPDRMRFVYNAVYTEQVRSYDVVKAERTGRYQVTARVRGRPDLSSFVTEATAPDLLKPWRPATATTALAAEESAALEAALTQDGFFGATREGLELPSHSYYWIGATCISGRFHFNAYRWPEHRLEDMAFPRMLFAWDATGIAVAQPKRVTLFDIYGTNYPDRNQLVFNVKVGENGLWRIAGSL